MSIMVEFMGRGYLEIEVGWVIGIRNRGFFILFFNFRVK